MGRGKGRDEERDSLTCQSLEAWKVLVAVALLPGVGSTRTNSRFILRQLVAVASGTKPDIYVHHSRKFKDGGLCVGVNTFYSM